MVTVREVLKSSDAIVGMVRDFQKMPFIAERVARSKRIREYLRANKKRRLQLGAGHTSLAGGYALILPLPLVKWCTSM